MMCEIIVSKYTLLLFVEFTFLFRGKSLLESLGTSFLPDWQPPLIFVRFTSKSHEHMHKKFEIN